MADIVKNLSKISQEIEEAACRSGRKKEDIILVAVTKTVPTDKIKKAIEAGITVLGENRVQELVDKYPKLLGVSWHLIGHLQRNKVKYIMDKVDLIHSLDSFTLAKEINRYGEKYNKSMNVLVQVNVAGENTKFGLALDEVKDFCTDVSTLPFVKIRGLMTIAPFTTDPEEVRPVFKELKFLFEKIKNLSFPAVSMDYLSMGMSNDFKVAIEEGANMVRIGSRIFGERNK